MSPAFQKLLLLASDWLCLAAASWMAWRFCLATSICAIRSSRYASCKPASENELETEA